MNYKTTSGLIICAIVALILTSGCTVPSDAKSSYEIPLTKVDVEPLPTLGGNTDYGVYKFTDPETGANCYIYNNYKAGGMSCDFK